MKLTRKLKILFFSRNGFGHLNSCTGVAEQLHYRGHQIVFAINQSFKGHFIKRGFEEEIIEEELISEEQRIPAASFTKLYLENGILDDHSPIDKIKSWIRVTTVVTKKEGEIVDKIIDRIKPDVIVVDCAIAPSIFNSGIPWVSLVSLQISTAIDDPRTPPKWLGLPANDSSEWTKYRELLKDDFDFIKKKFYHLFGDKKPFVSDRFIESPYLNIYCYPLELDYIDQRPLPQQPKWHRVDSFVRLNEDEFVLPEKLAQQKGKLIFFSMGSMGSGNVPMMKRLISLMADLPFRFIVAKGKLEKLTFN